MASRRHQSWQLMWRGPRFASTLPDSSAARCRQPPDHSGEGLGFPGGGGSAQAPGPEPGEAGASQAADEAMEAQSLGGDTDDEAGSASAWPFRLRRVLLMMALRPDLDPDRGRHDRRRGGVDDGACRRGGIGDFPLRRRNGCVSARARTHAARADAAGRRRLWPDPVAISRCRTVMPRWR